MGCNIKTKTMYETLNDLIMYAESCDNLWLLSKLQTLEEEINEK